jgi:pre-mRNA-splicing factor CWC22
MHMYKQCISVLQDFPAVMEDLDLVEEEDQFTHLLTLEDAVNGEDILSML